VGRVSDRIGGRNALTLTLAVSTAALAGIALSPVYLVVVGAAFAAGAGQAAANPATNKLISMHVAQGGRGMITGIKQSGVQVGVFLGGALLPLGAATIGWRPTLLLCASGPLLGLTMAWRLLPRDGHVDAVPTPVTAEPPVRSPFLVRLAGYGLLVGAGWSAVFTYLPDYGQNVLGWSQTTSGLLVATAGVCGIAGRIGWSWFAEHRLDAPRTLVILAALAIGAIAAILASSLVPVLLWLGAAALGASSGSWNSVGMFAIIDRLPQRAAGAASGTVMFGFLVGLGIGAPAFGRSVDATGAYRVGLVASAALHVAGLAMAVTLRRAPLGATVAAA
jgi:predicted MFS family arabinose efflux permease